MEGAGECGKDELGWHTPILAGSAKGRAQKKPASQDAGFFRCYTLQLH
jgi:hypothetical protein